MNPALNGSFALWHFEHSNAVQLRNGILFDFYLGLPHLCNILLQAFFTNTVGKDFAESSSKRQRREEMSLEERLECCA